MCARVCVSASVCLCEGVIERGCACEWVSVSESWRGCVCVTGWVWLPMMVAAPRFKTVQNKIQKSSSERCCHNFISKVAQTNNLLSTPFSNTINFIPMKKSFVVISWTSRFEDCCDRTNVVAASFLRLKIFDGVDTRQIFFYPRFKLSPISKTVGLACINFCCLCLSLSLSPVHSWSYSMIMWVCVIT